MASFSVRQPCSLDSSELTAVACSEGLQGRPQNTNTAKSHIQHLDPSHEWAERSEPQNASVAADYGPNAFGSESLDHMERM